MVVHGCVGLLKVDEAAADSSVVQRYKCTVSPYKHSICTVHSAGLECHALPNDLNTPHLANSLTYQRMSERTTYFPVPLSAVLTLCWWHSLPQLPDGTADLASSPYTGRGALDAPRYAYVGLMAPTMSGGGVTVSQWGAGHGLQIHCRPPGQRKRTKHTCVSCLAWIVASLHTVWFARVPEQGRRAIAGSCTSMTPPRQTNGSWHWNKSLVGVCMWWHRRAGGRRR